MILYAILATALFVISAIWMAEDIFYVVAKCERRPAILSILAFAISGEGMAILWWLVWSGK